MVLRSSFLHFNAIPLVSSLKKSKFKMVILYTYDIWHLFTLHIGCLKPCPIKILALKEIKAN